MNILRRGRLGNSVKNDVAKYTTSLDFDREIFEADILCDIAHVIMLMENNIISKEDAKKIIEGLKEIYKKGMENLNLDPSLDDIHMVIESELIKKLGEDVAGRMHTGRSRNDEVATDLRMALREKVLLILKMLINLEKDLLNMAKEHKETLMVGYTHLQHAQPTTFAHHLLSYVSAIERDILRLLDTYKRINISPLGSGAMATTGFDIDRERTKELLGFDGIIENSMDAVSARDFIAETMANLSILGTNLSKICEELILFSTYEFGIVEIANEYTSTSSIMPQKKNPDVAEIARAKLSTLNGNLISVLTILKALPNTYNRDLQEISPHLWKSVYTTIDTIKMIHGMLKTLKVNADRMRELANANYSTATELADTLVRECNIPFRTAHGIVGEVVRRAIEEKKDMIKVIYEVLEKYNLKIDEEKIKKALDPYENVKMRDVVGGPAPKEVERAIKSFKERINKYEKEVDEKIEKINKVKENLLSYEIE
ncbi:argininosuccinate lyase [Methanotorris igneus]|uniref:Argininosuccinate lyase n=1 Tax=Methanotorris igneus (strain DSM 5666 / JCM 11834 / Kol 5) TaxID=880724 RepID=F6BDU6_METIK|nr:argininosuccinate lyase [Methanotorris igneus]AEF96657.1 Argininosuccinate lyase [Methanotorris igneus Kol 5]